MYQMPNVLNFERKRYFFRSQLIKSSIPEPRVQGGLNLAVKRKNIFMDAYTQLSHRSAAELKSRLRIEFTGERGTDAGGLTRDFYTELSKELFNP